ncbi:BZ3500_MvSof-1268-A1-R1_Chr3-1g06087 [Microbotryum saponariae]|uniref:BZ3500_MvSof-1268-A1-R1_Chr3-1g06087 protein n=1 Tax=Microbotryum saponariae TaxID=289078 RepID=A0A2X0LAL4_9BASI|nr:BZ3500_MvSof-1268-A1-R1_Chr3-1g06087 [Microbotryum saponariae]SDA03941.1 BZ3501_MvSof-1269-A2-R1_Chr3-2g05772 [Microbotryum saponariae]
MEVDNLRNAARMSSQRRRPDIAGEVTPISSRSAPAPFIPVHPLTDDDSEWTALIQDLVRSGVEPHYLSTLGCSQLVVDIAAALSGSRLGTPPDSRSSVLRPLSPPISPHGLSTPSAPALDLEPSHAESIHKDKLLSQKAALALRNQARARSFEHELDSLLFAPVDPSAAEEAAPSSNSAQKNATRGVVLPQEEDPLTFSHERPHDNLTTSPTLAVTLGSSTPSGRRTPAQDLFVTAAPAALVIDLSDSEGESEETARPTFGGRVRSNPTVEPEHPRSPFLAHSTQVENLVRAEQLAQQEVALLRTKLELAQLQRRKQIARS